MKEVPLTLLAIVACCCLAAIVAPELLSPQPEPEARGGRVLRFVTGVDRRADRRAARQSEGRSPRFFQPLARLRGNAC